MWGDKNKRYTRKSPEKQKPEPEPEEFEEDLDLEDEGEEEPYWLSRWCDVFELSLALLIEANHETLAKPAAISETEFNLDTLLVERAREIANHSILQMKFKYQEFEAEERD